MRFPFKIQLDRNEIILSAFSGVLRCIESVIDENRDETHGSERDTSWHRHVEGRLAETAWAKSRNIYCGGTGKIFKADFGSKTEIRQTDHPGGSLLVHKSDDDDHWFILATGSHGLYVFRGFLLGEDAKRIGEWKSLDKVKYRPCFVIEQEKLLTDTSQLRAP